MAMTPAERKRKQRERGKSFSSNLSTETVTMSQFAKRQLQRMTDKYECTVSELIEAIVQVPTASAFMHYRRDLADKHNEGLYSSDDFDPIFSALNTVMEYAAKEKRLKRERDARKAQSILETYKPDEL